MVKEVYKCSKMDLCVKFVDNNEEEYLGRYACREGDPISVGDSLSKVSRDYNLYLYKKNEKGIYVKYKSFRKHGKW